MSSFLYPIPGDVVLQANSIKPKFVTLSMPSANLLWCTGHLRYTLRLPVSMIKATKELREGAIHYL